MISSNSIMITEYILYNLNSFKIIGSCFTAWNMVFICKYSCTLDKNEYSSIIGRHVLIRSHLGQAGSKCYPCYNLTDFLLTFPKGGVEILNSNYEVVYFLSVLSFWYHFHSTWRISFSNFYNASLLVKNSLTIFWGGGLKNSSFLLRILLLYVEI